MSRNKAQRAAARKLFSRPKGELSLVDLSDAPDWMTRAYRNNRYMVMIQDDVPMSSGVTAVRAMVQRHDDRPIPHHWREMQAIKNTIFGHEATGIEYYPPETELTDKACIYWLWVFPRGAIPVQNHDI